jgi:hypothetical protein
MSETARQIREALDLAPEASDGDVLAAILELKQPPSPAMPTWSFPTPPTPIVF